MLFSIRNISFKKQLLEEKEEALKKLRTDLEEEFQSSMGRAKSQWQNEKEAEMRQRLDEEVAKVNAIWEKEMEETKDRAIQDMENECQRRLDQALAGAKRAAVELKEGCSQTEPLSIQDGFLRQLVAEAVEEQTKLFQQALKEKESALREHEAKHRENIASQVESALKKAHGRWLQGLTELEEYKAHLKAARGKWEKESESGIAQQVSQAVSAAEEKWKKEIETCDKIRARSKELEEGMFSLQRELELKTEEIPAIVKAELAKARTQWNKEKQEEVLRMQEQNEKDYHSFLQEHRNKINEVLAKAKEDFAKQRKELLDQKEAELKMSLNRRQQEWAAQEAKRIQCDIAQHEDRILVQVELILDDLHKELVRPVSDEPAWSAMWNPVPASPVQAHLPFKEKLTLCLHKAYKTAVWATLERAKEKWKEKREDLVYGLKHREDSRMQGGEGETGDQARPFMYNVGQQVELERMLRKQPPLQETQMDSDSKYKKRNLLFQEDVCCEHCHRQLERKEKECQDLKKKLDKACRHLQLAAKEQEAKSEQLQENEKIVESLMEENSTVKNRLDNLKSAHVPPRSASEGCVSKPCPSCDGKALEEMRSQYLKAAGKIKSDMLRYIHESKERAAEIIKAEVLRERQETARKMRKYYLICLQQLLIDDGKHEGAEKKIISAAGKIATMAKLLETSVRSSPRDKATQSVPSQNTKLFSEVGEPHRNYMPPPGPVPMEGQASGESLADKTGNPILHRHLPCSLQQRLEAESQPLLTQPLGDSSVATVSAAAFGEDGSASRGLLQVTSSQKLPSCLPQGKPQDVHPTTCTAEASESGLACVRLKNPVDTSVPRERSCVQSMKHLKATSEKTQSHETLETPVRDGGASDWTLLSDTTPYPGQKGSSGSSDQFPSANLFSQAKEDGVVFCRRSGGNQDTLPVMKRPGLNCPEAVDATCTPYSNLDSASPSDASLNRAGFCSTVGKSYGQLYTRKQRCDVLVFQEDSGFDSPQTHLD